MQKAAYLLFLKRFLPDLRTDISAIDTQFVRTINIILDQTDLEQVFSNYKRDLKDPAVYFYEEFLRACDPENAGRHGVHYSPPAVVSYMTRVVESILQSKFGVDLEGAAIIDPCCGTGTFLKHVKDNYRCSHLIGFELIPDAAEIAQCLINSALSRQEGEEVANCIIQTADALSIPNIGVRDKPLVVIGNPPYSGHSSNTGFVESLITDYKRGLVEKNPKWLQDDYVKFIRIAQHWVERTGSGIVAFITNHSFIFNPTFRVMRESLMKAFDHIYIIDLNGNAKINADGVDENIFPIQMGVAVSFMVKTSDRPDCKISYAYKFGSREDKLNMLSQTSFAQTPWETVSPAAPFSIFKPVDKNVHEEFYSFPSILDLFEKSSVGFVTSRDSFAIDTDRNALLARIAELRDDNITPDDIRSRYAVGDLDIEKAHRILQDDPNWRDKAVEIAYRPFERRYTYLSKSIMERPRLPFMQNMLKDNVAIAIGRAGQVTGSNEWDVVFCVDCPADLNLFRRGGAKLFPIYLCKDGQMISNLKSRYDEDFYYIYAICHSTQYRRRYADCLASDYPRIPITKDTALFESLAALGRKLIAVHLLPNMPLNGKPEHITIGGYGVPCGTAVAQTLEIRKRIDDLISKNAPWEP